MSDEQTSTDYAFSWFYSPRRIFKNKGAIKIGNDWLEVVTIERNLDNFSIIFHTADGRKKKFNSDDEVTVRIYPVAQPTAEQTPTQLALI